MSKSGKEHKSKVAQDASIRDGKLYFEDVFQCFVNDEHFADFLEDKHLKAIRVVSLSVNWTESVWNGNGYTDIPVNVEMTIRKEVRNNKSVWYAYRSRGGKLLKRYVGLSDKVDEIKLRDIARKLPN